MGRKLDVVGTDVHVWLDVRVTSPARTWRDLALHLGLPDLVAAGDSILHGRHPLAGFDDLQLVARGASGGRGAPLLRAALPLLDGRSASRRETFLRLMLIRAGIDGFVPNHEVLLQRPRVRYVLDIAFPHAMLGIEYQSEYHHDEQQWRDDLTRQSRLRAHGWTIVEVSKSDLAEPVELIYRLRLLLARA